MKKIILIFSALAIVSCSTITKTLIKTTNFIYRGEKEVLLKIGRTAAYYELPWDHKKNTTHKTILYNGNVKLELIKKSEKKNDSVIYYAHGGAFIYPLSNIYRNLAEFMLGINDNYDFVFVDYRQLPYSFYPSGHNDYDIGLEYAFENYKNVYTFGDSAGGHLIVSTLLKRRDEKRKMPDAVVLLSPFLDISHSLESRKTNIKTDLLIGSPVENYDLSKLLKDNEYFKYEKDKKHPYISPVFGDFKGFPPTYIEVNNGELLYDESIIVKEKLDKENIENKLVTVDGLFHVYHLLQFNEAKTSLKLIFEFLDEKRLGGK